MKHVSRLLFFCLLFGGEILHSLVEPAADTSEISEGAIEIIIPENLDLQIERSLLELESFEGGEAEEDLQQDEKAALLGFLRWFQLTRLQNQSVEECYESARASFHHCRKALLVGGAIFVMVTVFCVPLLLNCIDSTCPEGWNNSNDASQWKISGKKFYNFERFHEIDEH